jgi:hypothetical protein
VKRIEVTYDGLPYTIGFRDLADVKNEIAAALESGLPYWMRVNHGEGTLRATEILITPGVGIAIAGIVDTEPGSDVQPESFLG